MTGFLVLCSNSKNTYIIKQEAFMEEIKVYNTLTKEKKYSIRSKKEKRRSTSAASLPTTIRISAMPVRPLLGISSVAIWNSSVIK